MLVVFETKLWLRRTKRKKITRVGYEGAWFLIGPNLRWSFDFTSDVLNNGRNFRDGNLKDICTCEYPVIEVESYIKISKLCDAGMRGSGAGIS